MKSIQEAWRKLQSFSPNFHEDVLQQHFTQLSKTISQTFQEIKTDILDEPTSSEDYFFHYFQPTNKRLCLFLGYFFLEKTLSPLLKAVNHLERESNSSIFSETLSSILISFFKLRNKLESNFLTSFKSDFQSQFKMSLVNKIDLLLEELSSPEPMPKDNVLRTLSDFFENFWDEERILPEQRQLSKKMKHKNFSKEAFKEIRFSLLDQENLSNNEQALLDEFDAFIIANLDFNHWLLLEKEIWQQKTVQTHQESIDRTTEWYAEQQSALEALSEKAQKIVNTRTSNLSLLKEQLSEVSEQLDAFETSISLEQQKIFLMKEIKNIFHQKQEKWTSEVLNNFILSGTHHLSTLPLVLQKELLQRQKQILSHALKNLSQPTLNDKNIEVFIEDKLPLLEKRLRISVQILKKRQVLLITRENFLEDLMLLEEEILEQHDFIQKLNNSNSNPFHVLNTLIKQTKHLQTRLLEMPEDQIMINDCKHKIQQLTTVLQENLELTGELSILHIENRLIKFQDHFEKLTIKNSTYLQQHEALQELALPLKRTHQKLQALSREIIETTPQNNALKKNLLQLKENLTAQTEAYFALSQKIERYLPLEKKEIKKQENNDQDSHQKTLEKMAVKNHLKQLRREVKAIYQKDWENWLFESRQERPNDFYVLKGNTAQQVKDFLAETSQHLLNLKENSENPEQQAIEATYQKVRQLSFEITHFIRQKCAHNELTQACQKQPLPEASKRRLKKSLDTHQKKYFGDLLESFLIQQSPQDIALDAHNPIDALKNKFDQMMTHLIKLKELSEARQTKGTFNPTGRLANKIKAYQELLNQVAKAHEYPDVFEAWINRPTYPEETGSEWGKSQLERDLYRNRASLVKIPTYKMISPFFSKQWKSYDSTSHMLFDEFKALFQSTLSKLRDASTIQDQESDTLDQPLFSTQTSFV